MRVKKTECIFLAVRTLERKTERYCGDILEGMQKIQYRTVKPHKIVYCPRRIAIRRSVSESCVVECGMADMASGEGGAVGEGVIGGEVFSGAEEIGRAHV